MLKGKMISLGKQSRVIFLMAVLIAAVILSAVPARAAAVDPLTDAQKNSSYGFFVWLSENAKTVAEREDAKVAAQILSNSIDSSYKSKVFNNGTVFASSQTVSYDTLLGALKLGEENDATSLEHVRKAIDFVSLGNEYRAKESLKALKISSALMAMGELSADYQYQRNNGLNHPQTFLCMENLAYQLGYYNYDPYSGWYTEEKKNYDTNNGGVTGHYETLTDRMVPMVTSGFGVVEIDSGSEPSYYAQEFSDGNHLYDINSGNTPEEYLAYLDQYEEAVIGHDFKAVEGSEVEATCTKDGKKADLKCSRCGEIEKGEVIPALGHNWDDGKITTEPTCIKNGVKTYSCSRCDETKTESLGKGGHKYGGYIVDKAATCTDRGVESIHCTECGEIKDGSERYVAALGHDWGEGTVTKERTETENGIVTYHCKNDPSHVKEETLYTNKNYNSLPFHGSGSFDNCRWIVDKDYKLTIGREGEESEIFNYSWDKPKEWPWAEYNDKITAVEVKGIVHVDGYCDGMFSSFSKCTVMDIAGLETSRMDTMENMFKGCRSLEELDLSRFDTENASNMSGMFQGCTKLVDLDLSSFDTSLVKNDSNIFEGCSSLSHIDLGSRTTFKSDAPLSNWTRRRSADGSITSSPEIEKISDYRGFEPGAYYATEYDKTAAHDWDEGVVTTKPTCTEEGLKTFTCKKCGETKTLELNPTGHSYGKWIYKSPTCTESGYSKEVCEVCGHEHIFEDHALGHDWDDGNVTKEATCTEDGIKTFKCSRCDSTKTEEVKALGHDYKEIKDSAKEATCTEAGKNADLKCSRCNDVKTGDSIAKKPHDYKPWKTTKEATCTEEGSESLCCSTCGAVKEGTSRPIPALGHNWGEWKVTKPATTEEEGIETRVCKNDSSHIQTRPIRKLEPEQTSKPDAETKPVSETKLAPTPAPGGDPKQMGTDGTAVGAGASAVAAEKALLAQTSDVDPEGAVFGKLRLKSMKQTKKSVTITWTKVSGATKYVIYGNKCGKNVKKVKLGVVSGKSKTFSKVAGKKVKKGTYYKFIVVALDKNDRVVSTSMLIHAATKGGKVGNPKSVKVKKAVVKKAAKLKKGKTLKLNAKQVAASKKLKIRKHVNVRYESSNAKIATVTKKGVVKGKSKGTCYVYAYAQNGVAKKIKVRVR